MRFTRTRSETIAVTQNALVFVGLAFCVLASVWALAVDTAAAELSCIRGLCLLARSSLAQERGAFGLGRVTLGLLGMASLSVRRFPASELHGVLSPEAEDSQSWHDDAATWSAENAKSRARRRRPRAAPPQKKRAPRRRAGAAASCPRTRCRS